MKPTKPLRTRKPQLVIPPPPYRRLRGYAFDPSLSLQLSTAAINRKTFEIPWETDLKPGPCGEYVEVLDVDPASGCWYDPVDLNARDILAQDGLPPSEGNPQFHQQMVYAVAMTTIANFERALGRPVLWANRYDKRLPVGHRDIYVPRLRIYPHALRGANAYYSPERKALLFGYFPGPAGTVFSCLSHDIVAHETTHALLDSVHRRFIEDNHVDTLAFHEAFADLIALLQHFTFPEVLEHQIAQTRGDLGNRSLLGELAQQFGQATGRYGALRSAIGEWGDDGSWRRIAPDPGRLARAQEPHERGAILVAAVFGAFLEVYQTRVADLFRLATAGSGVLPAGAIHPDLVARLAAEAAKAAGHFLNMCIRALDYCHATDITFGDYLRALITADVDMVQDDKHGYRVALIESFRRWGIVPEGMRSLSEEQLRWPLVEWYDQEGWQELTEMAAQLRPSISSTLYEHRRDVLFEQMRQARAWTHDYFERVVTGVENASQRPEVSQITGIVLSPNSRLEGLRRHSDSLVPTFEVQAVRPALRVSPSSTIVKQMLVMLSQRRSVAVAPDDRSLGTFDFRGGSTLIFDLEGEKPSLRYAITRHIDDEGRLAAVRDYLHNKREGRQSLRQMYFQGCTTAALADEPFALLHDES
jgi:hypothetical protein